MRRAGMLRMPYCPHNAGFSSTSTFTTLAFPSYCAASPSTTGAIMRQGPHQFAQKSTRTGWSEFKTSLAKVLSFAVEYLAVSAVLVFVSMIYLFILCPELFMIPNTTISRFEPIRPAHVCFPYIRGQHNHVYRPVN